MNERIWELAVQAKIQMVSEPRLQEFAELIARECANICDDLSFTPEGPSHEAKYQRSLCAEEIRKQFGVPAEFRKSS
jgi:hypothetical protein